MQSKYTDKLGRQLVAAYTALGAISFTCDAVGISKVTFYNWMQRGENGEEPYADLYFRMRRARAARAKALMIAARKDKGGPQFLLERLFPTEFGQASQASRHAMQSLLELIFPLISEDARCQILDALDLIERQRAGDADRRLGPGEVVDAE